MAGIARDPNGLKRVTFTDAEGNRRSVRLGSVSLKVAEAFRVRVEALLAASLNRQPVEAEVAAWLGRLPDRTYGRLARAGLVPAREPAQVPEVPTVGELLRRFVEAAPVKPATLAAYRQTTMSLAAFLGEGTRLDAVTAMHADMWRKALTEPTADGHRLAPATVAKRVHVARTIFGRACRWGMIQASPFAHLKAGSQSNPDRAFYVPADVVLAILNECTDPQWRTIIGLSRFAGLRCPSEIVGLRWGDVDWERWRLTVRSPKTAAHEGHDVRLVPIGPELRPILQAAFDQAQVGSEAVVPRLRDARVNLRTTFLKLIARAGFKPWPRLFHNLRASCENDWAERFPGHVVADWLGHSPKVAREHYLQTRDAHFEMATGITPEQGGNKSGNKAAQNAAMQAAARLRKAARREPVTPTNEHGCTAQSETMQPCANRPSGRRGIRTPNGFPGNPEGEPQGGNKCGDISGDPSLDPGLAELLTAWPNLPPAIRAGVLALIRAGK